MSDDIEVITDAAAAQKQNRAPEAPETPVEAAAPETAPEVAEVEEAPPEAPEEPEKAKSREKTLQGRLGHLTRLQHEKDRALAEAQAQIATYQKLLGPKAGETPAPALTDEEELNRRAEAIAHQRLFNQECDRIFTEGQKTYGAQWDESVQTLNAMGIMQPSLVEAAIAAGEPAKVLHALAQDLDEAQRIAALPPLRMAAEVTKIATKGSDQPQISRAPAPIKPVRGAANPEIDISDPNLDDDEYYRRRVKQGAWYKDVVKGV